MLHSLKQKGMVALMLTMTIIVVVTIITLFTARVIITDHKIYSNVKNNADAFNAAQAGFDYALGYLNANPFLIVTGLGYCAAANNTYLLPSPGPLSDGSTYMITFSCAVASDFITINLAVAGTSPDGTATRTVQATLKQYCGVAFPLITRSAVTIGTAATPLVANQDASAMRTISAGGTVTLNNGGSATTATGGNYNCTANYPPASPVGTCLNIQSNSGLGLFSQTVQFPQLYLGRLLTDFSALATPGYNLDCTSVIIGHSGHAKTFNQTTLISSLCTGGPGGGATLAGQTGKIIYMNMGSNNLVLTTSASSPNPFTLGSVVSPVIVVIVGTGTVTINTGAGGTFTMWGNIYSQSDLTIDQLGTAATTSIRGLVFDQGDVLVRDGVMVNGAIVSNTATIRNNSQLTYDSLGATYISNTLNGYCGGAYSVVSGSWRNF